MRICFRRKGVPTLIGIAVNPKKAGVFEIRDILTGLLEKEEMDFCFIADETELASGKGKPDALIVIGGDGSILKYAEPAAVKGIPVCGINVGRVGFLSEIAGNRQAIQSAVERLKTGKYSVLGRMMLACRINGGPEKHCLNDVVVFKRSFEGVTQMRVHTDTGDYGSVFCDGMIVSTPTGSTGYVLSAGGPVLDHAMQAVCLAPICSHSLFAKPAVIPPDAKVCISMDSDALVSTDGTFRENVNAGDRIDVVRSEYSMNFITFKHQDVFELVREKLG